MLSSYYASHNISIRAMTAKTDASEAPLALEAGKSSVQVTVSGSVQLR